MGCREQGVEVKAEVQSRERQKIDLELKKERMEIISKLDAFLSTKPNFQLLLVIDTMAENVKKRK